MDLGTREIGTPHSILVVNTDITQKKQFEAELHRAQRLESLGKLASGIAHDLNNVFTPIIGITQLLLNDPTALNERSPKMLQVMIDSAKRGTDLVNQVLTLAQGSQGKRSSLDINDLLTEVITFIQQTFSASIAIYNRKGKYGKARSVFALALGGRC